MNEKLRLIIDYYGLPKQLKYFQSEIYELNEAILTEQKGGCLENAFDTFFKAISPFIGSEYTDRKREHIKEEIADVMVMLKQFQLYYDISTDEIKEVMKSKVNRQIERINKEVKSNVNTNK